MIKNKAININGTDYYLRFDMYAMELLEDSFGSIQKAFDNMREGKQSIKTISALFVAMANSYRSMHDQPEDVTASVIRRLSPGRVKELQEIIMQAIADGMKTESDEREAGDDEYLAEARKNADGGVEAAN